MTNYEHTHLTLTINMRSCDSDRANCTSSALMQLDKDSLQLLLVTVELSINRGNNWPCVKPYFSQYFVAVCCTAVDYRVQ